MKIHSRVSIGLPARRGGAYVSPLAKTRCFLHYSTGEELGVDNCAQWVRNIYAFHTGTRKYDDIGYSWLVCKHGDVFEGRGWDRAGAHTQGFNTVGHAICALGDDDFDHEPAKRSVRAMFDEADRVSGKRLIRQGHRDVNSTSCPGTDLYAWLRAGMPLDRPVDPPRKDPTLAFALFNLSSGLSVDLSGHPATAKKGWAVEQARLDCGLDQAYEWAYGSNDGSVAIRLAGTDLVLDVANGSKTPKTPIVLWPYHGGDNQRWFVRLVGPGAYSVESKMDRALGLAIPDAGSGLGAPIVLDLYNNTLALWNTVLIEARPFD